MSEFKCPEDRIGYGHITDRYVEPVSIATTSDFDLALQDAKNAVGHYRDGTKVYMVEVYTHYEILGEVEHE